MEGAHFTLLAPRKRRTLELEYSLEFRSERGIVMPRETALSGFVTPAGVL